MNPADPKAAKPDAAYVNYGCGWGVAETWLNFDASPTLRIERIPLLGSIYTKNAAPFPACVRYGDIVRGLPVPDHSCDGVYASHVIEHLPRSLVDVALANTIRLLRPGGIFRVVVPDLGRMIAAYLADPDHDTRADLLIAETGLAVERLPGGRLRSFAYKFGNSRHGWLWDEASLRRLLERAGFSDVRRAEFNDSADPRFAEVELADRWDGSLGFEAIWRP